VGLGFRWDGVFGCLYEVVGGEWVRLFLSVFSHVSRIGETTLPQGERFGDRPSPTGEVVDEGLVPVVLFVATVVGRGNAPVDVDGRSDDLHEHQDQLRCGWMWPVGISLLYAE
jgi:hypothetical protein